MLKPLIATSLPSAPAVSGPLTPVSATPGEWFQEKVTVANSYYQTLFGPPSDRRGPSIWKDIASGTTGAAVAASQFTIGLPLATLDMAAEIYHEAPNGLDAMVRHGVSIFANGLIDSGAFLANRFSDFSWLNTTNAYSIGHEVTQTLGIAAMLLFGGYKGVQGLRKFNKRFNQVRIVRKEVEWPLPGLQPALAGGGSLSHPTVRIPTITTTPRPILMAASKGSGGSKGSGKWIRLRRGPSLTKHPGHPKRSEGPPKSVHHSTSGKAHPGSLPDKLETLWDHFEKIEKNRANWTDLLTEGEARLAKIHRKMPIEMVRGHHVDVNLGHVKTQRLIDLWAESNTIVRDLQTAKRNLAALVKEQMQLAQQTSLTYKGFLSEIPTFNARKACIHLEEVWNTYRKWEVDMMAPATDATRIFLRNACRGLETTMLRLTRHIGQTRHQWSPATERISYLKQKITLALQEAERLRRAHERKGFDKWGEDAILQEAFHNHRVRFFERLLREFPSE